MLVSCVAYEDGRKVADVPVEDISDWIERPGSFVWVGLAEPEPGELAVMAREFGLHPLAVEDALSGHQRPKLEEYGDSLFMVLRPAELAGEDLHLGEVCIFAADRYVLSVRRACTQGFAEVRARCEREPELLSRGSAFVLYALVDAVVDRYAPVVDHLADQLEELEDRIFGQAPSAAILEEIHDLKRRSTRLQGALRPLLDAVGRLHGGRVPHLVTGIQDYFRDVADHLHRLGSQLEAMREALASATANSLALISLQENATTKQLASWAALIAIPTLIAGLYGMNFENMPELKWQYGYPVALGIMGAVDGYVWWRLRKAGWL